MPFRRIISLCAGIILVFVTSLLPATQKAELRGIGSFTLPTWFKNSFHDLRLDAEEASLGNKRLMVYFGQNSCPYCAELFNNNFSQKQIVDYTRKHFDAIEINLWGDREVTNFDGVTLPEKQFAARHKVWFTPTILFFDEDGTQVLRINGYYPPHQFLAALKYVTEKKENKMSFSEYMVKNKPVASSGKLHPEPFFAASPYDLTRTPADKPIVVFFEQTDCSGCDQLHARILNLPDTQTYLQRFYAVQLNRWSNIPVTTPTGTKTTARAWADDLSISYVPSAVLFDDGHEIIRMEAMLKAFHVQSVLDYVVSRAYQREPNLQRFIQTRADHLREQGIVVDIWQ